jgi:hypothetical protein
VTASSAQPVGEPALVPSHPRALDDLATFLARARRADSGGAARLQALDLGGRWVLAVSVAPLGTGAGLPVALGLRVLALEEPADVDATVPLTALLDRLARSREVLPVPPQRVLTAAWAGVSPPRAGWVPAGTAAASDLARAAADGAAHVGRGADRAAVWSAPVPGGPAGPGGPGGPAGLAGATGAAGADARLPAGAALVADVLGFLPLTGELPLHRAGPWWRLSTPGGHVLARPARLLR